MFFPLLGPALSFLRSVPAPTMSVKNRLQESLFWLRRLVSGNGTLAGKASQHQHLDTTLDVIQQMESKVKCAVVHLLRSASHDDSSSLCGINELQCAPWWRADHVYYVAACPQCSRREFNQASGADRPSEACAGGRLADVWIQQHQ